MIISPPFSGAIQLGALVQVSNAFERLSEAVSWFIGSYTSFAEWRATVDHLTEFGREMAREARDVGGQLRGDGRAGQHRAEGFECLAAGRNVPYRAHDTELGVA